MDSDPRVSALSPHTGFRLWSSTLFEQQMLGSGLRRLKIGFRIRASKLLIKKPDNL